MGKYILGLHASHNASACIGDDSGLIYAIQEERITREKNYWGFPKHALEECLNRVGATPDDLLAIACGGNQVLCRYHDRSEVLKAYRRQGSILGKARQRFAMPIVRAIHPQMGQRPLQTYLDRMGLGGVPRRHYDHHLAHAATAFYGLRENRSRDYLVLTCDGSGDGRCATIRVMSDTRSDVIKSCKWANSLGAIYAWTTFNMGFVPLEHEYKLMGMAPYAPRTAAEETARVFHSYLGLDNDGLAFKRRSLKRTNDMGAKLFDDLRGQRFDHICGGLQRFTEVLLCKWVANAVNKTGVNRILAAGGVFMNVKANKRIAELPEVASFEAFPSCGDETLSIGAYYLEAVQQFGANSIRPLRDFYLSDNDSPNDKAVKMLLDEQKVPYRRPHDITSAVADIIVAGHPIARCAGPMEFGARALGNRSILADPKQHDMIRVINRMVKKRDFWMPFSPMIIARRQHEYLHNPKDLRSPFMMMTFDTKESFGDLIAAVHNADLSCRPQILEEQQNPEMYRILEAFEERTGRGALLNTSFNLHGYPIVRSPRDALDVFVNSGLEYMQIGEFLVHKR